jgi:hypothetical protein
MVIMRRFLFTGTSYGLLSSLDFVVLDEWEWPWFRSGSGFLESFLFVFGLLDLSGLKTDLMESMVKFGSESGS